MKFKMFNVLFVLAMIFLVLLAGVYLYDKGFIPGTHPRMYAMKDIGGPPPQT